MADQRLIRDSVTRIGEVCEVQGRKIFVRVDREKNLSDLHLDGDVLKNVAVNSYVEIRKGFQSIIGRVEGEKVEEELIRGESPRFNELRKIRRTLSVSLSGYIDQKGKFSGGTRELPLVGNEAYIVTKELTQVVHSLVQADSGLGITIAKVHGDDFDVTLPIDGLFNSHIAIFGNTGSGKSNTLTYLYQELCAVLRVRNESKFETNSHFVLFDFNGEYTVPDCITPNKTIYNLSTRDSKGDKLPLDRRGFLDTELISVLADATEKTQKPFIDRSLNLYRRTTEAEKSEEYLRNQLRKLVERILLMSDRVKATLLLDYLRKILPDRNSDGDERDIASDLEWYGTKNAYTLIRPDGSKPFFESSRHLIKESELYKRVALLSTSTDSIRNVITFMYVQLTYDVLDNRAQNEHIAPAIGRLEKKKRDIEKIFETKSDNEFWKTNFVVVNLDKVNLDMKKTIPLLLAKNLYKAHKDESEDKALTIIVDEAHNILSTQSSREAESWKDYRLETFEEIIKEGRKFGVFITIASQRPNDISPTITSQAHNYFIHRLVNQNDLRMISTAVSYIDANSEEAIPTLPTGTCVFSGVASQIPLLIDVKPLPKKSQPKSDTLEYRNIVGE